MLARTRAPAASMGQNSPRAQWRKAGPWNSFATSHGILERFLTVWALINAAGAAANATERAPVNTSPWLTPLPSFASATVRVKGLSPCAPRKLRVPYFDPELGRSNGATRRASTPRRTPTKQDAKANGAIKGDREHYLTENARRGEADDGEYSARGRDASESPDGRARRLEPRGKPAALNPGRGLGIGAAGAACLTRASG